MRERTHSSRPRQRIFPWIMLLAACVSGNGTSPQARTRPNFILLMADDQGWGELGSRGHPYIRTPQLDAMAAEGLTLERFYAAAPVCSPTRGSVLTGRHPTRYGCLSWGHVVPPDELTLAELMHEAGYATGHFGKWHVGSVRAKDPTSPGQQGFEEWLSSPNFFDLDPLFSQRGTVVETQGEGSEVIVDAALDFIQEASQSRRPFLAVIWFGSPHLPHHARSVDLEAFAHLPEPMRAYCAEIAAMDRSVGRLREELRRLGIAESSLLWYTSDNGPRPPIEPPDLPAASTAGLRGRKGSLWEGGLRVPAILEWPGKLPRGQTHEQVSGTVDILPTVLDLADIALPFERVLDGESLVPLLSGNTWERATPLGFWIRPAEGRAVYSDKVLRALASGQPDPTGSLPESSSSVASTEIFPGSAAWIDGSFKLHRIVQDEGSRYELYELGRDPNEQIDLAAQHPERVDALRAALEKWQASVVDDPPSQATRPAATREPR